MIFSFHLIDDEKKVNESKKKSATIVLILFLFTLLRINNELYKDERRNIDPINKKIEKFEKSKEKSFFSKFFTYNDEISVIKQFRNYNSNDVLIKKDIFKHLNKNKIPEVSVIITVYNQEDCFYKGLRSVQNQSLKNIEIIMVDDHSLDNSVEKIEKYQKDDNRIILLKHTSNYGKIKSRSDAIKLARGQYITIIDGDDALAKPNILFNSLTIAKIGNLDIVEFKAIFFKKKHIIREKNNVDKVKNIYNRIIYQPELKHKFINLKKK